jgi:hypothetical protein
LVFTRAPNIESGEMSLCDAVNSYGLRGEPNRIASGVNDAIAAIQRNTLYFIRPTFVQEWAYHFTP